VIDLPTYLHRIGFIDEPTADLASLRALHVAHMAAIPFENIDVRLRRPIRLDLRSLQDKLVTRRRGGYCFEQNSFFSAVLREIGFQVDTLEARVRPRGATRELPRTHMTLRVKVDGRYWLADVGFGGDGPIEPVPLDGEVSEQWDGSYEVGRENGVHVLRRELAGEWYDMYAFTLAPALPVDFEVASYYTSTHPTSAFLNTLTVQRSEPSGRHILRGRTFTSRVRDRESTREIMPEELPGLLRGRLCLDVTDEEALEALGEG
jgi:N-hydroxyarylamine O-acetyltransferase